MDMYARMMDDLKQSPDDNPTVGIIPCADKASLYAAHGKHEIIRICRSGLIRKTGHKITFDLYDEATALYSQKCFAYTDVKIVSEPHCQHCYRVSYNERS